MFGKPPQRTATDKAIRGFTTKSITKLILPKLTVDQLRGFLAGTSQAHTVGDDTPAIKEGYFALLPHGGYVFVAIGSTSADYFGDCSLARVCIFTPLFPKLFRVHERINCMHLPPTPSCLHRGVSGHEGRVMCDQLRLPSEVLGSPPA
jgi:hypothetical protein